MKKSDLMHSHLKVRSACHRLNCAIDDNPEFFRGLKIPANERHYKPRNRIASMGAAAFLLTLFVRIFH